MKTLSLILLLLVPACSGDDDAAADADADADADTDADTDADADSDGDGDADADADSDGDADANVETDCDDGEDDDLHGDPDCLDFDCDGIGPCEHGVELSCGDGLDNDGRDGADCADPDCLGTVECPELACLDGADDDGDGAADCLDPDCAIEPLCVNVLDCDDGQTSVVLHSLEPPLAIADDSEEFSPGVDMGVDALPGGTIAALAVGVTVTHPRVGDVELRFHPPGKRTLPPRGGLVDERMLSRQRGGDGADYAATIFRDDAATGIADGTAPFEGEHRPESPLARWIGFPTAAIRGGTRFSVEARDVAADETGTLDEVTIYACLCEACELGALCVDGVDNDADGLLDCEDERCASDVRCSEEVDCGNLVDDNWNRFFDCEDPTCVDRDPCELPAELTCDDGFDNDADVLGDCADPDCGGVGTCEAIEATCDDGLDNDGDTAFDCADPSCDGLAGCEVFSEHTCDDGIDNEADGTSDCEDVDCLAAGDCPGGVALVSDRRWRVTDEELEGWTEVGFDDSGWLASESPAWQDCGNWFEPQTFGRQSWESWEYDWHAAMWSPLEQPTAWFRRTFEVPDVAAVTTAQFTILADDDYVVWVNGVEIARDPDNAVIEAATIELTDALVSGTNAIAIWGDDTFGGCRFVYVNGRVEW